MESSPVFVSPDRHILVSLALSPPSLNYPYVDVDVICSCSPYKRCNQPVDVDALVPAPVGPSRSASMVHVSYFAEVLIEEYGFIIIIAVP